MSLSQILQDRPSEMLRIQTPISTQFEIAAFLKKAEPQPVLFEKIVDYPYRVAGNLYCTKETIAKYLGIPRQQIIQYISQAISSPSQPQQVEHPPCQEIIAEVDLFKLPILRHFEQDGGPYITSGVVICKHPKYGQNLDFHRMMVFSHDKMAVRVVRGRHFDTYLAELGEMDVAVCVGVPPNILLAAAISVSLEVDELTIANSLYPVEVAKALTADLWIPAQAEFVIEGRVSKFERHPEGPFVDLTETLDIVRQEPVMTVKAISHRTAPIWHALLPGGLEHKTLMGMPREPTIFHSVNQVVPCIDVYINPGGCSWLHAIVQIDKQNDEDGKKAIFAAFQGHKSLKHVFVVDRDIDIYDPLSVEWALATRFQADRDLVILPRERGSSLDPSASEEDHLTTKVGFDLTKPLSKRGKSFDKVTYPDIKIEKWLSRS
ncbi:MAG: UbiD family decarboxylase [Anaerolineales bacterium]